MTLTLYRDDSTAQVAYERVKTFFWTAGNSVLTIAQYINDTHTAHRYIHWPRERFCWFRDDGVRECAATPADAAATVLDCLESALGEYDAANNSPEYSHDEWRATAVTLCMLVSEHRAELLAALRECAATPSQDPTERKATDANDG